VLHLLVELASYSLFGWLVRIVAGL